MMPHLQWELVEACCLLVVAWELEVQVEWVDRVEWEEWVVQVEWVVQLEWVDPVLWEDLEEWEEDRLPSEAVGMVPRTMAPHTRTTTTTMEEAKIMETVVAMTKAMDKHLSVAVATKTLTPHLRT